MSKLSYIHSSYGKPFSIAVANTTSYNVMSATYLPSNTLIIASPIDSLTYEDIGAHSLIVTDFNGTPVRLTYEILAKNGLIENKDGSIELKIDNQTIKENINGELYANLSYFVNSNGFELSNGKLSITTATMHKATDKNYGVFKVDGKTILANNGKIYVNTSSLDYANDNSQVFGIVSSESSTIKTKNGVLRADATKLSKTSPTNRGILKADGNLVNANDGKLSFSYTRLNMSSNTTYGLSSVDATTIVENTDQSISLNVNGLRKASSVNFGIVKGDGITTSIDNGTLTVNNYSQLQNAIMHIGEQITELNLRIADINNEIENLSPTIVSPTIFTFVCDGLSSATLVKPSEYGEVPEKMPVQKVSATFIINTNCPFKIGLQYLDNVDPEISLYEINYNDIDKYPGVVGLTRTYQSTQETDVKITLSWLCKNYRTNKTTEYSNKTRVILKVMYANDISINKEIKYSITRFNSLYNEKIDYSGQNDEIIIDKYKNKINKNSVKYDICINYTGDILQLVEEPDEYTTRYIVNNSALNTNIDPNTGNIAHNLMNVGAGTSATIMRYIEGKENSEKPITKQQISDGRIIIDTYSVSNDVEQQTNEVSLYIDNYANIILQYNGAFIESDDSDYEISLVSEDPSQFTYDNNDKTYIVNGNYEIYLMNNDNSIIDHTKQTLQETQLIKIDGGNKEVQIGNQDLNISYYEIIESNGIQLETRTSNIGIQLSNDSIILAYTGTLEVINDIPQNN